MIDDYEPHPYGDEVARQFILDLGLTGVAASRVGEYPGQELSSSLPYVSVELVDADAGFLESSPVIDIDVFAATRAQAKSLASAIQIAFLGYPRTVQVEGDRRVTVDMVTCLTSPVKGPWEDPNIRRQMATYQFSIRR